MPAPAVIKKGITTIVWGSGNSLTANSFASAIVESIAITPKNSDLVADIEDNNGYSALLVLLPDGFSAKVTCVYDAAIAWPVEGANTALALPVGTGNANAGYTSYTCLVVSQSPALARKKEAMIEISLVYRPNVTS